MSSKTIETILKFVADETAARKAIRVSEGVREALGKTAKQTLDIDAAANKLNAEFAQMARAKAISNLSAQAIEAAQETGDWATQLKRVATELSNIGASDDEIRRVAQSIGEAQTARVNSTGGSRSGGALDSIDRFGSVGSQIAGGLGGGSTVGNVVGLIGDAAGALTNLNPIMLGLTGVTAAVTVGIAAMNAEQEAAKQRIQATTEALQRESSQRQQLIGLIGSTDAAGIAAQQAQLRASINAITQEELNPLLNQQNDLFLRSLESARTLFPQYDPNGGEIQRIAELGARSLPEWGELQSQIEGVRGRLAPLNDQLGDLQTFGVEGVAALARVNASINDLARLSSLSSLTTEQLDQRINTATANQQAYATALATADAEIQAARQAGNQVLVDTLTIQRTNLQSTYDGITAELKLLNTRGAAIAAANDLAALEAARAAQELALADQMAQARVAAELGVQQMTEGQRSARVRDIKEEIAVLAEAAQQQGISADYTLQLKTRIAALGVEMNVLQGVSETLADKMQAGAERAKALSAQTDRYFDALKREGDARDELLKAQQELTEADTKAAAEAAKAAAEAETRRTEILAEGGEQREELERKTQDALRKIDRDYNRDYFQAVAERDALAAAEAAIRRADALEDQKESDDEAQRRLDQAQQKQLRSLEKSLQDQGLRLAEAQQRERDTKQRAYLQAQNDLINAENATRNIQTTAIQGRVIREGNAYQQISSLVDFYMTAIVNRFTAGLQSMLGAVPGTSGGYGGGSGAMFGAQIDARVDARMARAFRDAHR